MLKEWLKFALALVVCAVLLVLVFALALYCRERSEGETERMPDDYVCGQNFGASATILEARCGMV